MGETPGLGSVGGNYTGGDYKNEQHAGRDIAGRDIITNINTPAVGVAALRQLPAPPNDFTGRVAELDELRAAVVGAGAVGAGIFGLRGLGGVGKTALALVLAHELKERYPDAQLYVDLKGAHEQAPLAPAEVLAMFIRAFVPTATQLPERLEELRAIYHTLLADKKALVLLDNARDGAQVTPLLPPPGCVALITSRQHFALPGLVAKNLGSLPRADAVALLLKIAPRMGAHAEAIAQLCGDLPLALRLAGSALVERENLTPPGYVKRLEDEKRRFVELDEVQAALAISESLLTLDLQTAWRALAVFPAGFDWPAARAVWTGSVEAGDEITTTDTLGDLLRYSLLEFEPATERYRLHDLARRWARGRLSDEAGATARQRHAAYYWRALAHADELYLEGGDQVLKGLALFDREQANIEAGQAWAAAQAGENEQAAKLCSTYPDAGVYVLDLHYQPRQLIAWLESALAAARRLGNQQMQGNHLNSIGSAYMELGEPDHALEYVEQALVLTRATANRRDESVAVGNLGVCYRLKDEPQRAVEYFQQQLEITREIGYRRGQSNALGNLGNTYVDLGEALQAIDCYEKSLIIKHEDGDWVGEANTRWNASLLLAVLGERSAAVTQATVALGLMEQLDLSQAELVRRQLAAWRAEEPPAPSQSP